MSAILTFLWTYKNIAIPAVLVVALVMAVQYARIQTKALENTRGELAIVTGHFTEFRRNHELVVGELQTELERTGKASSETMRRLYGIEGADNESDTPIDDDLLRALRLR